jgi:maltokinase
MALVRPVRVELFRRTWPLGVWLPIETILADGASVTHQLAVGIGPRVPDEVPPSAVIGEVATPDGTGMAFDAFAAPELAAAFINYATPDVPVQRVRPVPGVRSGAAFVADDRWFVKAFRRIESGEHPGLELARVLAERGVGTVTPPVSSWRRGDSDLVGVARWVRGATSGAAMAAASIADVLERRCKPRESRLDFARSAEALGQLVASIHVALAAAFGSAPADGVALAGFLIDRLERRRAESGIDLDRVQSSFARLAAAEDLGTSIRVHGDLGLARVVSARSKWWLVDFDVDDVGTFDDRRVPISPLADVAAVLSSVSDVRIAAVAAAEASAGGREAEDREARVLGDAWEDRAVDAFVAGYTSNDQVHRLLPVERTSRDALLSVFELDRTVARLSRDARRDPGLIRLPTAEVDELLSAQPRRRW